MNHTHQPPHPVNPPPHPGVQRVHPPQPAPSNDRADHTEAAQGPSNANPHHAQRVPHPVPTRLHPPPAPYDPSRAGGLWYHPHPPPHYPRIDHDWNPYHHYPAMPFQLHPNQYAYSPFQPRTALPASMTTTPLSTPVSVNPSLPSSGGMNHIPRAPLQPLTESAINSLHIHNGTFDPSMVKQEVVEEGEEELSPTHHAEDDIDDPLSDIDLDPNDGDAPYLPNKKAAKKAASAVKARHKAKKGKGKAKAKGRSTITKKNIPASPLTTTSPATTVMGAGPSHAPFYGLTGQAYAVHPSFASGSPLEVFQDLKNAIFPLMPPPEGTFLDVNDLLIRHPPALSPTNSHEAINQYTNRTEQHSACESLSKWEMYSCRACRKTYDGKNARSVARRHLQDKHGIPLSRQARRTRWDQDADRPKDQHEAQERSKKCKRDWAKLTRQQRALEKLHGGFLFQFGPLGLQTSWKHPLIAPIFRDNTAPKLQMAPGMVFKTADQVAIPPSLRESALLLQQIEAAIEKDESMPFVSFEDLLHLDEGTEFDPTQRPTPPKLTTTTSNGSIITNPTPPLRDSFHPYTSTPSAPARLGVGTEQDEHGPDLEALLAQPPFTDSRQPLDPTEQYYGFLSVEQQADINGQSSSAPTIENNDGDEAESPPPLWVEPSWQEWREFPSTSSAGLQLSLPVDPTAEAGDTPPQQADEAAESLLNMYSSPAKAPSTDKAELTSTSAASSAAPTSHNQWKEMDTFAMIADYSSRPPLKHTKSLSTSVKHPFINRPGHMARSLSTTTLLLEDPFVLDSHSSPARNMQQEDQHTSASPQSKSRPKSQSQAASRIPRFSPSPVIDRKRRPLETVSTNLTKDSMYETPLRPSRAGLNAPSSVGIEKWLQFSSPIDPAASLGLVPTHAVPTTPGLSMIIGQDTPAGPAGGKKNKSVGVGVGVQIR